jgi:hypothetical protein
VNGNHIKNQKNAVGYGGSLETELVMNQHGARFNGIQRSNASGILVQVDSDQIEDKSSRFALVDEYNHKIAILPIHKKAFISLPGFTDQNYTLMNLSKTDYYIQEPVRHITLYPGNVHYYVWKVEKRIIIIGRAMIKPRHPLANTWIHVGENGIFSDNDGYFQLELSQNTKTLLAEDICKMHLPNLRINKTYLYMGEIACS